VIDQDNTILAGHGRVAAAQLLGMGEVPCLRIETMSATEKRAYVIADNKLALNAGWDEEILGGELNDLLAEDLEFDIGVTGFSIPEIDSLVEGLAPAEPGASEDDILPAESPARCRPGDLWQLGPHRLICCDALDPSTVATLMGSERAQMVFTDPPYNVPIQGHVGGLGAIKHREFAMATGEVTKPQFTAFLRNAFERLVEASADGSIHFVCMDWRHMAEMLAAADGVYAELKNLIVWAKDNGGTGSFYRSRHELVFAFKNGTAPHVNAFELGQHGRYRTNVWSYRGVNTLRAGRMEELALHPTVKPVQMIGDAIKDVSRRGAVVLDLFGGSGSTLVAAHKTGRRAYVCELDPVYCDRIIQRYETYAKDEAELIECGIVEAAQGRLLR
jgi:DNA modification methylase